MIARWALAVVVSCVACTGTEPPPPDAGMRDAGVVVDRDAGTERTDGSVTQPVSRVDLACSPTCGFEILARYPHDTAAYTQGLVIDRGVLFEGTGLYGESSLRRVDLASGTVQQSTPLDAQYFGEGITTWQETIIQLTWRAGVAFVYDRSTFAEQRQFQYTTEGWGITHDGVRLIMSDGTSTLYFRDPVTFAEMGTVEVRDGTIAIDRLNELEYVEGEVFANVWTTDQIVRISPADGRVVGTIDLTDLPRPAGGVDDVLNGIAYEPSDGRLYVTGKRWPEIFEIRLVPR